MLLLRMPILPSGPERPLTLPLPRHPDQAQAQDDDPVESQICDPSLAPAAGPSTLAKVDATPDRAINRSQIRLYVVPAVPRGARGALDLSSSRQGVLHPSRSQLPFEYHADALPTRLPPMQARGRRQHSPLPQGKADPLITAKVIRLGGIVA